mmetsp:Transcript_34352/g.67579  ORF Transcript_34352/g.67579 Transcript_34352/m.67579 type:complete len:280 (+) Transcript_34352:216-1055(+)
MSTRSNKSTESDEDDLGGYDSWMVQGSQEIQEFNLERMITARKNSTPLQRIHSGVKVEVFNHRKTSTFRPSPLDIETKSVIVETPRCTCSTTNETPSFDSEHISINVTTTPPKDIVDLTGSMTRNVSSDTKSTYKVLRKDDSILGMRSLFNEEKDIKTILQIVKKIERGQIFLENSQDDLKNVVDNLIAVQHLGVPEGNENDTCNLSKEMQEPKDPEEPKDHKLYVPTENFVAELYYKLGFDELAVLVVNAGFEHPGRKEFSKKQLVKSLFPHLKNLFN